MEIEIRAEEQKNLTALSISDLLSKLKSDVSFLNNEKL